MHASSFMERRKRWCSLMPMDLGFQLAIREICFREMDLKSQFVKYECLEKNQLYGIGLSGVVRWLSEIIVTKWIKAPFLCVASL